MLDQLSLTSVNFNLASLYNLSTYDLTLIKTQFEFLDFKFLFTRPQKKIVRKKNHNF